MKSYEEMGSYKIKRHIAAIKKYIWMTQIPC